MKYPRRQCAALRIQREEMMAQPQKCFDFEPNFFCNEHWYLASSSAASCPPAIRGEIDRPMNKFTESSSQSVWNSLCNSLPGIGPLASIITKLVFE